MRKESILIAGNFVFPDGNAAGKRVLGIGYVLADMGYKVFFIGNDTERKEERIVDTGMEYQQFCYFRFEGGRSAREILNYRKSYFEYMDVVNHIGIDNIACVILYGSPTLALWDSLVMRKMSKYHIPVIFDCVDWIETSGFKSVIKNIVKYVDTNYMKRILAPRCNGVIAISRYLYEYYSGKNCVTMLLPPIGRRINGSRTEVSDRVRFIYAGCISKRRPLDWKREKDRLDITIELIASVAKRGINVVFDIYGVEKDEYLSAKPEHEMLFTEQSTECFVFHGKVSNSEVCEALNEADIMVLNRDVTRVTTAGFPTKVSESLCAGIPVMTNDTSNIIDYVSNNVNGWIISSDKNEAREQIIEICRNKDRICRIKENCRKDCVFDYRKYLPGMDAFLRQIGVLS